MTELRKLVDFITQHPYLRNWKPSLGASTEPSRTDLGLTLNCVSVNGERGMEGEKLWEDVLMKNSVGRSRWEGTA
jgi:hypothetical protein